MPEFGNAVIVSSRIREESSTTGGIQYVEDDEDDGTWSERAVLLGSPGFDRGGVYGRNGLVWFEDVVVVKLGI